MNISPRVILAILLLVVANVAVFYTAQSLAAEAPSAPPSQQICLSKLCQLQSTYTATSKIKTMTMTEINGEIPVASIPENKIQYLDEANKDLVRLARDNRLMFGAVIWFFGFLLAFTPCVLPLIILITGFLGQTNEISYSRSILLALTYVMSLSVTFAVLGVLAASFGIYLSVYFQSPWLLGLLSILLAILALSLLGFYKIKLPFVVQLLVARHNKLKSNYQFIEMAIMGVFATLITSPCIAAPLVGVLCYIGENKDILLGAYALFAFGMGIGTPLILATTINRGVLPQNKNWQSVIKFGFGIVVFAIAIKLSAGIIPTGLNMVLWSLLIVFSANYMFSIMKNLEVDSYLLLWKSCAILLLTYGVLIFVGYMMGNKMPTNPLVLNQVMYVKPYKFTQISTIYGMDNAIENAKAHNMPIMVLFSADWCTECQSLKAQILNDHEIQEKLDSYFLLEVNLSTPGSSEQEIAKKYHIAGTPEIIFFNSSGELRDKRVVGAISNDELEDVMVLMRH